MAHVARGMVDIRLASGAPWPEAWGGEHGQSPPVRPPPGWQIVSVLLPEDGPIRRAEDRGYSPLIRRWHHTIEVAPDGQGGTRYTDRLDISAGLLTPVAALFARILFAHRQRRLVAIAARGFDFA